MPRSAAALCLMFMAGVACNLAPLATGQAPPPQAPPPQASPIPTSQATVSPAPVQHQIGVRQGAGAWSSTMWSRASDSSRAA